MVLSSEAVNNLVHIFDEICKFFKRMYNGIKDMVNKMMNSIPLKLNIKALQFNNSHKGSYNRSLHCKDKRCKLRYNKQVINYTTPTIGIVTSMEVNKGWQ